MLLFQREICFLLLFATKVSGFVSMRPKSGIHDESSIASALGMRVAYQGEPGAYSEKSTRELLGKNVVAIGRPDFESCFKAVASMEVDYACLPVENSLGGSIHENFDLMLRYDLTICAEHEFRVQHCMLAMDGVRLEDIKYAISHPQALAQCDNYLRSLGIRPIPTYDTAGSAKMIAENDLPQFCTPENTCAIASDLAGTTYGMNCLAKGIEDDDSNFTRFLLLGRKGVAQYLDKSTPSKTSIVFTQSNTAGALYKALACFSLRDIDMTKIESRPTSASLLNYLKFQNKQNGDKESQKLEIPRFRYCFYVDFLSSELDENTENALSHLRENADYVRILGSYPQKSRLVGPILETVEDLKNSSLDPSNKSLVKLPSDDTMKPLNIGILGFGRFGQFLASQMKGEHTVSCMDELDRSIEAEHIGIDFYSHFESNEFLRNLDVIILSVPIMELESVVRSLSPGEVAGKLIVDVTPLNSYPKAILLKAFESQTDVDILVTNPMFGPPPLFNIELPNPAAQNTLWDDRPMAYERVRISDMQRCLKYLSIFENARCRLLEMDSEQHDASTADAQFVTQMVGRVLKQDLLPPTPIASREFSALSEISEAASDESFDLFFGMFKYNERAKDYLVAMRENLAEVERKLAAREAYLEATAEIHQGDRQRLLAETKLLLQELARNGVDAQQTSVSENVELTSDDLKSSS